MITLLLSCCLSRQGLELPEGTQSSQILLVAVYSGGLGVLHALILGQCWVCWFFSTLAPINPRLAAFH